MRGKFSRVGLVVGACARLILFLLPQPATADVPLKDIPDDSRLRVEYLKEILTSSPRETLGFPEKVLTLPDGSPVRARSEGGGTQVLTILARPLPSPSEGPAERDLSAFLDYAQGSWVLYRDASSGTPMRVRWFLRTDPYCFLQIRRDGGDRSVLDLVAYGAFLARNIPLGYDFDSVLTAPLSRIVKGTDKRVPWRYLDPDPGVYSDARRLVTAVRERLPALSYEDDGAFDEGGLPVYIETGAPQKGTVGLNCSGFAKWIVDGLLRPETGRRLSIAPLIEPTENRGSSFSEPYEDELDPYFGLDWTRNLAAAAWKVLRGSSAATPDEYNVQASAVVALRSSGGDGARARAYPDYSEDSGFAIEGLEAVLYALAIDEPGYLYLASVNMDLGSRPRLRRHFHVAALVPYFDEEGRFKVALFESAAETKLSSFVARYPSGMVHLVRIPLDSRFDP